MGSSLDGLVRDVVANWRKSFNPEEHGEQGYTDWCIAEQVQRCADELEGKLAEAALAQGSAHSIPECCPTCGSRTPNYRGWMTIVASRFGSDGSQCMDKWHTDYKLEGGPVEGWKLVAAQGSAPTGAPAASGRRLKFYVWTKPPRWVAVAFAGDVKEARELMLEEIGSSGDGSCPEREAGAKWVRENNPAIWHEANAEFALTDSAELREQELHSETLQKRIKQLEAAAPRPELAPAALAACPKCGGDIINEGHGYWCRDEKCKWGWEMEMDGSPLREAPPDLAGAHKTIVEDMRKLRDYLKTRAWNEDSLIDPDLDEAAESLNVWAMALATPPAGPAKGAAMNKEERLPGERK